MVQVEDRHNATVKLILESEFNRGDDKDEDYVVSVNDGTVGIAFVDVAEVVVTELALLVLRLDTWYATGYAGVGTVTDHGQGGWKIYRKHCF